MSFRSPRRYAIPFVVLCLAAPIGCATKGQTGALAGSGVGALLGQVIGGNTASTLIGAGVGTGLGYIVGNEMDKKDVQNRTQETAAEMAPFSGTTWSLVSNTPAFKKPIKSLVARFNSDGTVTTTATMTDGKVETNNERYRVVGSTVIINQRDYLINAKYRIEGDRLYMDTNEYGVVFARV